MSEKCRRKTSETVSAVLELLAQRWPQTFAIHEARRRPLKIGIHNDILAALGGAITPAELSTALACYTANLGYLRKLRRAGAARIDLNDKPAGEVTPEQANIAALMLSQAVARKHERKVPPREVVS
jgi:ProP effector